MSIHPPVPSLLPDRCICGEAFDADAHRPGSPSTASQWSIARDENGMPVRMHWTPVSPIRTEAVARRSDPDTSHEAARSVTSIRESHRAVLRVFKQYGGMTDEDLLNYYTACTELAGYPRQSDSGLRTRRSELVAAGKLRDSGKREQGRTGRRMIVWELAA